jgi:hypothetical protein
MTLGVLLPATQLARVTTGIIPVANGIHSLSKTLRFGFCAISWTILCIITHSLSKEDR